jgi:hypothetical protein
MSNVKKIAVDIDIGDHIMLPDGTWTKVTGWFFPARSGIELEYGGRWNLHHMKDELVVRT